VEDEDLEYDLKWGKRLVHALSDARYDAMLTEISRRVSTDTTLASEQANALKIFYAIEDRSLLQRLFELALSKIQVEHFENHLQLCIAPIPSINGLAIASPKTRMPVILLNHGMISYFSLVIHLLLGLTSWKEGETYCDHFSDSDRIHTLFQMAEAMLQVIPAPLVPKGASACVGPPDHIGTTLELHDSYCLLAELFVIFHELGHVACGHLRPDDVISSTQAGIEASIYNRSQVQEFEADAFALEHLKSAFAPDGGVDERMAAHAAGLFLCFAGVLEQFHVATVDTHPPAFERWSRIRNHIPRPEGPSRLDSVDYFFDWLTTSPFAKAARGRED
jgi:hypothetical protein